MNLPILVPLEREFQSNELPQISPPQTSHYESINAKLSPENLLSNFSFRHFIALMRIKEPLKRAFYEKEAIKGQWEARFLLLIVIGLRVKTHSTATIT